jgi:hypothetical protein
MKRTPLRRKTPLQRSGIKRHHPHRRVRFEANAVYEAVTRRSRGICELCRDVPATEMHHRRMRSAGGLDIYDNILHLCGFCHHEAIHANPDWAYRHGLLIRRSDPNHPPPVIGCWMNCDVDHMN